MEANSLRYILYFYYYALRGLLRKQTLIFPQESFCYQHKFKLTKNRILQWEKLFNINSDGKKIPFTYFWPEFEQFYLKTMDALCFNYRNVLHLGHEISYAQNPYNALINEVLLLKMGIQDIVWFDRDRAVILIEGQIDNMQGQEISKSVDAIFLRGLSEQNLIELKNSPHLNRADISAFKFLSKRESILSGADVKTATLFIPKKFGTYYGRVSGDRNPVHVSQWLAKIFGYSQAFIQGSATVNFLIKHFVVEQKENIQNFTIRFCRPIFMGQTIEIRFTKEAFELLDNNKKLLAFGSRVEFPRAIKI